MDQHGQPRRNGALGFVRAHAGVISTAVLISGTWTVALWFGGILALPAMVKSNTETVKMLADSIGIVSGRILEGERRDRWVICTTIPPNTRRELSALRVRCDEVNAIRQNFDDNTNVLGAGTEVLDERR